MSLQGFFSSFLHIINEMSPYLLLGFLIAGILHVFVPKNFYAKYLSRDNKFSVLWAALWECRCRCVRVVSSLRPSG